MLRACVLYTDTVQGREGLVHCVHERKRLTCPQEVTGVASRFKCARTSSARRLLDSRLWTFSCVQSECELLLRDTVNRPVGNFEEAGAPCAYISVSKHPEVLPDLTDIFFLHALVFEKIPFTRSRGLLLLPHQDVANHPGLGRPTPSTVPR